MFAGVPINNTEGRAVLHVALRAPAGARFEVDGGDVMPAVAAVRERVGEFATAVREGAGAAYTGEAVSDVVNIGIGGSDLGPAMACQGARRLWPCAPHHALRLERRWRPARPGAGAGEPARTLFVIASKTFTTIETMTNAASARAWFLAGGAAGRRTSRATSWRCRRMPPRWPGSGSTAANMFGFWDWVGGRYSMWSAVGLPIALWVGRENFEAMLDGAHGMDRHFAEAPLEANMPAILALLGCGTAPSSMPPACASRRIRAGAGAHAGLPAAARDGE